MDLERGARMTEASRYKNERTSKNLLRAGLSSDSCCLTEDTPPGEVAIGGFYGQRHGDLDSASDTP
jgi:hypothetical protein